MHCRSSLFALVLSAGSTLVGCSGPWLRPQDGASVGKADEVLDIELVGDVTHPYGMNYVQIEDVGLVVGLDGTGGNPGPTPQRAVLMSEMKRREVDEPGKVLASPDTAMVLVRGFLRPGVQQGDRFDVEVRVPTRGNTTSLRGGKLLAARLTELAAVDQQIHSGHVLALAEGPVLVDPAATPDDEALATRGRVLGGGVVRKSRTLGLGLDERYRSFRLSQLVGTAINRRFHMILQGEKQGVANPKTDEFVELQVHPRYRDNVSRYMQVVRSIAIEETQSELQERLLLLEKQLQDPLTVQAAALRLEAIGSKEAIRILKQSAATGLGDESFFAAEALAYLDQTEAVDPLERVIREDPERRVQALAALSAMNDRKAYEALRSLLGERSAETRYGAFRALWAMNPHDPLVKGEQLGSAFTFHVVQPSAPQMVHVTNSLRPEIVLFGGNQRLQLPVTLDAGKYILVHGTSGGTVTVSRFAPGVPAQKRVVEPDIEKIVRAVVDLGGTYPDVVQMLQQAHHAGALAGWFRVDALPGVERENSNERLIAEGDRQEGKSSASPAGRLATSWSSLFGDK